MNVLCVNTIFTCYEVGKPFVLGGGRLYQFNRCTTLHVITVVCNNIFRFSDFYQCSDRTKLLAELHGKYGDIYTLYMGKSS